MKTFSIDSASGGSGWGVAKVDSLTLEPDARQTISVSDLGVTSIDDYTVVLCLNNSGESTYFILENKTAQSFTFYNDTSMQVTVTYAILAKGYGVMKP